MENARKNMGLRLGNGQVILTGFRVGKFANAPEERKASNGVVIASVSRFVPVKGLDVLLKACALMDSEFSLLMVGSGPEEGRLRRIAKERGISGSVRFLGFRHDVPQILRRSDVFVVSSFSEGLPTSLLEAMAAGCACVVTDIGLPIGHMKTGVVVRPGSPEEMGKALDFLAGSSPLRRKLGENAREFVLGNCTQEMAAGKHERLFRELLRRGKRS
jgi:glycosyltransferase involved in cell wall biosynthesis